MIKSEDERKIFTAVIVMITLAMLAMGILEAPASPQSPGSVELDNRSAGEDSIVYAATRVPAPSNVVVPDVNSEVSERVARPVEVSPAAPKVKARFRNFNLEIHRDRFSPDTVIVNKGDTVRLNLTAVDGDYDFFQPDYGLARTILRGQTEIVQFDAVQDGKFTFYCKGCGGPNRGPRGYLIATPRT